MARHAPRRMLKKIIDKKSVVRGSKPVNHLRATLNCFNSCSSRVHFMDLGQNIFGVTGGRSGVIFCVKSVLGGVTAFQNLLTLT